MNLGSGQKATFRKSVHFGPHGARISSTEWRLVRTVFLGGAFTFLTVTALALLFGAHAMLLGIALLICAAGVLSVLNRVTSAWSGNCPHCHSEIFVRAPGNIKTHGFDCPTCSQRVILRDQYFTTISAIQSAPVPIQAEAVRQDTGSKRSSYGFIWILGLLALAIIVANASRALF
jgi:hypothetical protein